MMSGYSVFCLTGSRISYGLVRTGRESGCIMTSITDFLGFNSRVCRLSCGIRSVRSIPKMRKQSGSELKEMVLCVWKIMIPMKKKKYQLRRSNISQHRTACLAIASIVSVKVTIIPGCGSGQKDRGCHIIP